MFEQYLASQQLLTFASIAFFGWLLLLEQSARAKQKEFIEATRACNPHGRTK